MIRFALLVAFAGIGWSQATPKSHPVPTGSKELVEYVQEARRLGLKESELRQNAIKAGWKADLVDIAIHSVSLAIAAAPPISPETLKQTADRPDRGATDQYVIGEGDVLQVAVWKEPEASVGSVVVRADGKITLPFLKELQVAGMTLSKAEEMVTAGLKPFINEPDVTVVIREVHSKKIYLLGAVRRTGLVELRYPMTVLQALTEAGGPSDFAKKKKIYVLRTVDGKQFRLPFDWDAVIRGESMELNIWVMPNDMIIVPQ